MERGIEILNKPEKGDVLVWDGKGYKHVNLKFILKDVNKTIFDLESALKKAENEIVELKKEIKYLKGE